MSPELVRNVAGYAVVALGSLVWYVGYLWWWNPERRRADVERWSMRHMAAWDARWQEPIERQLKADVRVDLIWVFLLCGVRMEFVTFKAGLQMLQVPVCF